MNERSRAAGTGKASSCGSGGGGGVAYEASGYKQGWADGRAGKTGKPTTQIEPRAILACNSETVQDRDIVTMDGRLIKLIMTLF